MAMVSKNKSGIVREGFLILEMEIVYPPTPSLDLISFLFLLKEQYHRDILYLLRCYSDLVRVYRDEEDGLLRFSYKRAHLIRMLDWDRSDLVITSFERKIKHANLVVIETTHSYKKEWKSWMFKSEINFKQNSLPLIKSLF